MQSSSLFCLILIVLLVLYPCCSKLTVVLENSTRLEFHIAESPSFGNIPKSFEAISMKSWITTYTKSDTDEYNVTGAFLLADFIPSIESLKEWQSKGVGVVCMVAPGRTEEMGMQDFMYAPYDRESITMQYLGISVVGETVFRILLDENVTEVIVDDEDNVNEWAPLRTNIGLIILQACCMLYTVIVLFFGVYKMILFIMHSEKFSIAHAGLALELFALILQLISLVDPLLLRGIFSITVSNYFRTAPGTFSLIGDYLLLFFWVEVLDKRNLNSAPFLTSMLPCFIIIGILLIVSDTLSSMFSLTYDGRVFGNVFLVLALYGLLVITFTSTLILCTVPRVLKATRKRLKKIPRAISKITGVMTVLAILNLVTMIFVFLCAYGFTSVFVVNYIVMFLTLVATTTKFLKIWIYNVKTNKSSKSKRTPPTSGRTNKELE